MRLTERLARLTICFFCVLVFYQSQLLLTEVWHAPYRIAYLMHQQVDDVTNLNSRLIIDYEQRIDNLEMMYEKMESMSWCSMSWNQEVPINW